MMNARHGEFGAPRHGRDELFTDDREGDAEFVLSAASKAD